MRVLAINNYNYTQRTNKLNTNKSKICLHDCEQPTVEPKATSPAFKGAGFGVLGAIAGGLVGFMVAGPVGAVAGAALGGGTGASQDDKLPDEPYTYNPNDSYDDTYRWSHYD